MKTFSALSIAGLLVGLSAATPSRAGDATSKSAGKKDEAVSISPNDIKWGDAPPTLPKGAQMTVLHGDPGKSGPFTARLKAPNGYKIPPHWHSKDEQLTVLSGTLVLHMGDTMDAPAHELSAGAFHFLPAKMHHAAEMKGDTIVQLDGMGPFDINYLNPADKPKSAALIK
jgi:quercetin dioxygenase-like cupin family protein